MGYADYVKMVKKADGGVANDETGAVATSLIPVVGPVANAVGAGLGWIKGKPIGADMAKMDAHPGWSYIPGVASYRLVRKQLETAPDKGARRRILSEALGPAVTVLLAAGLGGLAARGMGKDWRAGALAGGVLGSLPSALGHVIGRARKRRTEAEQQDADSRESLLMNLTVPGYAAYNSARRQPAIIRHEDARNSANA